MQFWPPIYLEDLRNQPEIDKQSNWTLCKSRYSDGHKDSKRGLKVFINHENANYNYNGVPFCDPDQQRLFKNLKIRVDSYLSSTTSKNLKWLTLLGRRLCHLYSWARPSFTSQQSHSPLQNGQTLAHRRQMFQIMFRAVLHSSNLLKTGNNRNYKLVHSYIYIMEHWKWTKAKMDKSQKHNIWNEISHKLRVDNIPLSSLTSITKQCIF